MIRGWHFAAQDRSLLPTTPHTSSHLLPLPPNPKILALFSHIIVEVFPIYLADLV